MCISEHQHQRQTRQHTIGHRTVLLVHLSAAAPGNGPPEGIEDLALMEAATAALQPLIRERRCEGTTMPLQQGCSCHP
jgi:hypothetical protein